MSSRVQRRSAGRPRRVQDRPQLVAAARAGLRDLPARSRHQRRWCWAISASSARVRCTPAAGDLVEERAAPCIVEVPRGHRGQRLIERRGEALVERRAGVHGPALTRGGRLRSGVAAAEAGPGAARDPTGQPQHPIPPAGVAPVGRRAAAPPGRRSPRSAPTAPPLGLVHAGGAGASMAPRSTDPATGTRRATPPRAPRGAAGRAHPRSARGPARASGRRPRRRAVRRLPRGRGQVDHRVEPPQAVDPDTHRHLRGGLIPAPRRDGHLHGGAPPLVPQPGLVHADHGDPQPAAASCPAARARASRAPPHRRTTGRSAGGGRSW